ncbi:MAG: ATP-grasp domain-containing protein [Acidimicrobiales bacterium]
MPRILLLLPTATYRAPDFLAAAARMGVDVVVASEHRQALAESMGDRAIVVPLDDVARAVEQVVALNERRVLDAVVAVDDQGVAVASAASAALGLRHNRAQAVAASRDKRQMRGLLRDARLPQPDYAVVKPDDDVVAAADVLGYPCVIKPVSRAASQGVIRVNDGDEAQRAGARIRRIPGVAREDLLVETFVPGAEVAVEGLLDAGHFEVLAVFDKPDPLDGPYFEETIYVTPSRQPDSVLEEVGRLSALAAAALGLVEGPVHVELRIGADGAVTILELAARSIGGLCARALRFGAGVSLEELIIRHALGLGHEGLTRERGASGVMMLPIRAGGVLEEVRGQELAQAVEGVVGVEITVAPGRPVVPLPEGERYLGFIFARGSTAQEVELALRRAEASLDVRMR